MNTIKTKEDVLAWAKVIVAAKGEKYTPLAKGDMFAIANFIVEAACPADAPKCIETKPDAEREKSQTDAPMKPMTTDTSAAKRNGLMPMPRSQLLRNAGFTVQQAYDKFLEWGNEHPKEAAVMDFSTGVRSKNAAFAYWLSEMVAAEIPD